MSDKAKRFLEELFVAFIKNPKQLPAEYQRWIEEAGLYQAFVTIYRRNDRPLCTG